MSLVLTVRRDKGFRAVTSVSRALHVRSSASHHIAILSQG